MDKRDSKRFHGDLLQAIVGKALGKPITGLIAEHDQEMRRGGTGQPFTDGGIMTSFRALSVSPLSAGGALVDTSIFPDVVEALRAYSIVARAGGQFVSGLVGDLAIPREVTEASVAWMHSMGTVTPGDPVTGQINGTPHPIKGCTRFSTQLSAQAPATETFLRRAYTKSIAAAVDKGMLNGSGVMGEVLGINNVAGTNTVTFSGAATVAKLASFERKCSDANAENIVFVAGNRVREKWRTIARLTSALALWEGSEVIGRTAYATSALGDIVIAGDFSNTLTCFWGGNAADFPVNVLINPYSRSLQGEIEILVELFADCLVLQPGAFTKNADTAIA